MDDGSSSDDGCLDVSDSGEIRVTVIEKPSKRGRKPKAAESESEMVEPLTDVQHFIKSDSLLLTTGERLSQHIYKMRLNYGSLVQSKMASNNLKYLPFLKKESAKTADIKGEDARIDNLICQIEDIDKSIMIRVNKLHALREKYKKQS